MGALECPHCGIIFAKYFSNRVPTKPLNHYDDVTESFRLQLMHTLFTVEGKTDHWAFWGRITALLILALFTVKLMAPIASNTAGQSFLHLVNLPFHEFGHILFRPLGAFMASLGGSLGQLLMPAICFYVFVFQRRDPFAAAVALWWFGENFVDMAPYINDARDLSLPLLGGNFGHSSPYGFHDWQYILNESGLLQYERGLARCSFLLGFSLMLLALAWAVFLLLQQKKHL